MSTPTKQTSFIFAVDSSTPVASAHDPSDESDEDVPTDMQQDVEKVMDVLQKAGNVTVNNNVTSTQLATPKSNKDKPTNASSEEDTLPQSSSAGDDTDELDDDDDDDDEPCSAALDTVETSAPDFAEKRN